MSIFSFDRYRDYLRSYLRQLPNHGRGELSRMARHLKVNSTLLSQVLAGGRDLSLEQTYELSFYLGHNEFEMDYFDLLVRFERAGSDRLKRHLQKKIRLLKKAAVGASTDTDGKLTDEQLTIYYSSWLYTAVHLMSSTFDRGVALEDIMQRFHLSRSRAAKIVSFLVKTGLCHESSGRYEMAGGTTLVEAPSPHLLRHLANWRLKAIQRSESLTESEVMFTGQVSLSRADFRLIKEKIVKLISDVNQTVQNSPAEDMASLNVDWFWVKE